MAQSMTVTVNGNPFLDGSGPFQIICDWVSGTGGDAGNVNGAICGTYAAQLAGMSANPIEPKHIRGLFKSCQTIPGANGDKATAVPTEGWNLILQDAYGEDILAGNGANQSASASKLTVHGYGQGQITVESELTVVISGAGDTRRGRIILEFAPMET